MAVRDRLERGQSAEQAERSVNSEFGNAVLVQEVTRGMWRWNWVEQFRRDVRYSIRTMLRNSSFTAVAIVTLALGIGTTTAVFSVVNGVLLRPLPYPDPGRLVWIHDGMTRFDRAGWSACVADFLVWRKRSRSFQSLAAFGPNRYTVTGVFGSIVRISLRTAAIRPGGGPLPAETMQRVFERVQTLPGVQSAGATVFAPLTFTPETTFEIKGRPAQATDAPSALYYPVTPNFFHTMKIGMLRGRDFTMDDTANSPWVMIVNETMARRFWPNEDPIGQHVRVDISPEDQPREIVAVVHDTPSNPQQRTQQPAIYVPFFQAGPHSIGPKAFLRFQLTFVLRTQGDPMSLLPALRGAVAEIDPNRPIANPRTLDDHLAEQVQYPRYYSMLLGLFAFVATLLAAVGIYGIMAYAVEQRTREIGIRMALGAGAWRVSRLVIRQAMWMIVAGLALGVAGAMALTRFISSELWEVQSTDPATFAGVSLLLMAVALLACLVPTRRAMQVDPTIALRYE